MKLPTRNKIITHLFVLIIGIVIGWQIPGFKSAYHLRQAEKYALEQFEKYPNEPNSWLLISEYRWRRGDVEGSFQAAHKALEIDPNYEMALERIAFNYIETNQQKEGKKWLKKALASAKKNAPGQIEMLKFALSQLEKEAKP